MRRVFVMPSPDPSPRSVAKHTRLAELIATLVAERVLQKLSDTAALGAPEYLTVAQVSYLTGLTAKALETMRSKREGPPYLKVGARVRYRRDLLSNWLESFHHD